MTIAVSFAWILCCGDAMNLIRMQVSVDQGKYGWLYLDRRANPGSHMYKGYISRKKDI